MDKARDICRQTQGSSILISQQSYKKIVNKVNNFAFTEQEITIDGSPVKVYSVRKRRGMKKRLASEPQFGPVVLGTNKALSTGPHFGGIDSKLFEDPK